MKLALRFAIPVCLAMAATGCGAGADLYTCSFAEGQWDPADWTLVKSPRWDHFGGWVQADGYIENEIPADATADEMLGPRAAATYTSMVLNKTFGGDVTITSTMDFAYRMAPLIVLAPELGRDAKGRAEYREHYEIVLFDKGVNVWHHSYADGKPSWVKAAKAEFPLKPNIKYRLQVKISQADKGKLVSVSVAGQHFQYVDDSLSDRFHVGITGCEGTNRFYDFTVLSSGGSK